MNQILADGASLYELLWLIPIIAAFAVINVLWILFIDRIFDRVEDNVDE
ncbi:hypothetical protein [Mesorhizobium sp. M4B.F.Ca.ET.058.02.1.1]|nr:hypothetical protein [Mesorhizobium sp. M4B.F.Ca.ET.058.02.1.1]